MAMIKAFSLLEIMVVIVIVGILATFGHLTYVGYTERAKTIEALAVLDDYQSIAMQLRTRYDTIAPYYGWGRSCICCWDSRTKWGFYLGVWHFCLEEQYG